MREPNFIKSAQGRQNTNRHFRRNRAVVMALLAIIQIGLLFYIAAVVGTTREWRMQNALERHRNTARLCAWLIDEQCENAVDVLHSIAGQPALADTLASRKKDSLRGEEYLREAVQLVPDLMATAIYSPAGDIITRYPATAPFPLSAREQPWFHGIKADKKPYVGDVIRLRDKERTNVFTIAVPIESGAGGKSKQGPYLLAFYRMGNANRWLRDVRIRGGIILLSDVRGRVITSSTATSSNSEVTRLTDASTVAMAMRGEGGALQTLHPAETDAVDALVGYALATYPRLAVLVVQPVATAFTPTDYLLARILWVTIPLLVLVPLAAWNLMDFYHREQRLTQRLSEQNKWLEQNARLKSEVLANVSHDLKTPIASMQLSLSGMLDTEDGRKNNAIRDGLSLFQTELAQLSARVRNLLDMSRLEVEEIPSLRETCDLTDIVASALERLRMQVRDRPITAHFPPEPLLVECDQSQMETAILNLLENAVKYSPQGSPLHLEGAFAENAVRFQLRDEGPGIDPTDREHIFGKFYRARTRHAAGGTGLGLAICKAIVEAHGGTVSLQSDEDAETAPSLESGKTGATFIIRLPMAAEILSL